MIKKLTTYFSLLLALLFTGCAEEDWLRNPFEDAPDRDYAELSLAVAAPQTVRTRAGYNINDSKIENATVLIYEGNNDHKLAKLLQGEYFTPQNGANTIDNIKIEYEDEVKKYCRNKSNANLYLFVVANHTFSGDYPATVEKLLEEKDAIAAASLSSRTTVTMGGFAGDTGSLDSGRASSITTISKSALNSLVTVQMCRDLARAYVENAASGFSLDSYSIWSAAPTAYALGGLSGSTDNTGMEAGTTGTVNGEYQTVSTNPSSKNYVYAYGQKALGEGKDVLGKDNRAFVIVKGYYDGEECYYRVDLRRDKRTEEEKKKGVEPTYDYLYLTPNHEYQIKIVKVKCKGYPTDEEAAKHPQQDYLEVEIHDHVPAVLSMTSDGQRELGVETPVEINPSGAFALKLFSIYATDYPSNLTLSSDEKTISAGDDFSIQVTGGSQWLRFTGSTSGTSNDLKETGEYDADNNSVTDDGKIYHIGLTSISQMTAGTQTGKVLVTWHGLTREVEVKWVSEFDLSSVVDAKLEVNYGGNQTFSDYWQLLKKRPTSDYNGIQMIGVDEKMNNGNIRNEGIHLPLGLGGDDHGSEYQYTYTLTMKGDFANKEITAEIIDDVSGSRLAFPQGDFTVDKTSKPNKITIKANSNSFGRQYFTGKLIIKSGTDELPAISVYRTGFFWPVETTDYAYTKAISGKKPQTGWYYYEVRSFGGRMWLDRNICATSSGMAIISNTGASLIPSPDSEGKIKGDFNDGAIGPYYLPANYVAKGDVESNLWNEICPPGFRIPKTNEWDEIRNSFAFNASQTVTGGVTYYQANIEDDNGNTIFFPKGMYYNDGSLVGDSRAGYYWTASEAAGLEKEEIGRWLQALVFTGGANSYMHGNIQKYGMQIRAVEDKAETVKKYTFGFKVKGATHVYIYDATEPFPYQTNQEGYKTHTDDIKSGLMTWPGIAIGEASTMSSYYRDGDYYAASTGEEKAREYTFTYTTTTKKENLRFVFTYVENGKIYVFSRKKESGHGAYQYNGWPLLDSYYFGFTDKDNNVYHHDTSGSVNLTANEDQTYKFFFLEHPLVDGKNPEEWPKGGAVQTLYGDNRIQINAHWNDSRWEKKNINGVNYYVFTFETNEIDWSFKYNWRYNEGNNVTYSSKGGVDQGPTVNYDKFVYNDTWGAYCVTIYELFKSKAGAPGNSGDDPNPPTPVKKDYRIYFPDNSTKMHMWWTDSSNTNHPFFDGVNGMSGISKEGSYYYIDFDQTGNDNEKIKFARQTSDVTDKNFTLSQFTAQTINGATRYCAYIDTDDNFNAGKPSSSTPSEKTYRLIYPEKAEKMYLWKTSDTNNKLINNEAATGDFGCYKYREFKHTGDLNEELKFSIGKINNDNSYNYNNESIATLGSWIQIDGIYYAYIDYNGNASTGVPKLYIIGKIQGNEWSPANGVELTYSNGIYKATEVELVGDANFCLTDKLESSWDNLNYKANRYGGNSDGQNISATDWTSITCYYAHINASACKNLKPNDGAGSYTVEFDIINKKIKVYK